MQYIEPIFRPPSEAKSLILQVTNGCSWNNCTFCDMYTAPQKKFKPTAIEEIEKVLKQAQPYQHQIKRIFLADGDAMTLSVRRLTELLKLIKEYLPNVQRVSSYCLPRNLKNKSIEDLASLKELGLTLMYVGCESGDDLVLEKIKKGETYDSSLSALKKIKAAGMKSSVMILNGMGGQQLSEQHAINSAKLMNAAQPEYLSTLVVSFPMGLERTQEGFDQQFTPLNQADLFKEIRLLIDNLQLDKTIFRSDHASNYLVLKGVLGKDKGSLLQKIDDAIHRPGSIPLREEWQRGL
ncbi:radical SAM protein [Gammaproteobacteria bacterium 45_16_T64]|nr:radical SAM protein [Gammaproteobacteria bacterium 45_16_T64]